MVLIWQWPIQDNNPGITQTYMVKPFTQMGLCGCFWLMISVSGNSSAWPFEMVKLLSGSIKTFLLPPNCCKIIIFLWPFKRLINNSGQLTAPMGGTNDNNVSVCATFRNRRHCGARVSFGEFWDLISANTHWLTEAFSDADLSAALHDVPQRTEFAPFSWRQLSSHLLHDSQSNSTG